MEMGRRWTAENLPRTNWIIWRWIWRPRLALRGFFNIDPFRHVMILHGCAVGGGSITYANTLLVAATMPSGTTDRGPAWRDWKTEMPRHYRDRGAHAGRRREPHPRPGGPHPEARGRRAGVGDTFYRTSVAVFEAAGGRGWRPDVSRPVLRRRRTGAHHLHRLRRLHDGLPLQRQEYPRQELPLPGREARRARLRRNPVVDVRPWMAAPTAAKATRCAR